MDTEEGAKTNWPVSGGIVAILLILGALFVQQMGFKASRPVVPGGRSYRIYGYEDIPARLWEDPFSAVMRHRTVDPAIKPVTPVKSPRSLARLADYVFEEMDTTRSGGLTVLGVMCYGGQYAEDIERRIRYRYAIISALDRMDYSPADAEHLGYFETGTKPARAIEAGHLMGAAPPFPWIHFLIQSALAQYSRQDDVKGSLPHFVPYECFSPNPGGEKAPVVLLWLEDEAFTGTPLKKINELVRQINFAFYWTFHTHFSKSPKITFKFLGPAGSTTLSSMVDEVEGKHASNRVQESNGIKLYSWSATATDQELLKKEQLDKSVCEIINTNTYGIQLLRSISDDGKQTEALVDELERRGVTLPGDHIVLITEWDTFYGRSLPAAFIKSIRNKYEPETRSECKNNVSTFSYLRGIDGQLPGAALERLQDTGNEEKKGTQKRETLIERPVGRSQYDYLRRLQTRLDELNYRLQNGKENRRGENGIKAIGVLGSDVYDKLLVLQALRKRFPNAIFFTIDIDARLFHPEEYDWTRNLIIASSFGLELNPELQKKIPPFRDNYQTSLFFSTILALGSDTEHLDQAVLDEWMKYPRIYEIGRNGPKDLSIYPQGRKLIVNLDEGTKPPFLDSIHPTRSDLSLRSPILTGLKLLAACTAFTLLYIILNQTLWKRRVGAKGKRIWRRNLLFFGSIFLAILVLFLLIHSQLQIGEPFALFEGISIWPSVLLKIVALAFAIMFACSGYRKLRSRNAALRYYLIPYKYDTESKRARKEDSVARDLFCQYYRLSRPGIFSSRVFINGIAYYVVGLLVVFTFGFPHIPFRGRTSQVADILTTQLTVLGLIILISGVLYATHLSVWLIRRISKMKMNWPDETTEHILNIKKSTNEDRYMLDRWMDVKIIARHTKIIAQFIYYPFVVIVLMLIARGRFFDNWDFPPGLCAVILWSLIYVLYCAIALRYAAEKARKKAITILQMAKIEACGKGKLPEHTTKKFDWIIEAIRTTRDGAFASILNQPWLHAVVLLFGSGGSLILLEYLGR